MTVKLENNQLVTTEQPSEIQQAVLDWINDIDSDDREMTYDDLQNSGCASGMVSEMIYYSDTLAFYDKHKDALNAMLAEAIAGYGGVGPSEVLRDWDSEDPLCLEQNNQNLMAWFGFESTAFNLFGDYFEEETS